MRTPLPSRRSRLFVGAAGAATLVAVALPASPAYAASATVATPNGIAGVAQSVWVSSPANKGGTVPVTFSFNGSPIGQASVALNARGIGTATWTPTAAGTWTVSGAGASSSVNVASMPTVTDIAIPNALGANVETAVVVTVRAAAGTTAPTGSVAVSTAWGGAVGSGTLVAGSGATASATIPWTPTAVGEVPLLATYSPSAGMGASTSPTVVATVGFFPPTLSVRLPSRLIVGVPVTVTSLVSPSTLTGTAAVQFSANGTNTAISGSLPLAAGSVASTWTPSVAGNQLVISEFSGTNPQYGTAVSAVAQAFVAPAAALATDPVNVSSNGIALAPTGTVLRNGTPVTVVGTSGSAGAVALNATGACAMSGSALFATANKGTCTVTAYSPGNAQFASSTTTYTLTVQRRG